MDIYISVISFYCPFPGLSHTTDDTLFLYTFICIMTDIGSTLCGLCYVLDLHIYNEYYCFCCDIIYIISYI